MSASCPFEKGVSVAPLKINELILVHITCHNHMQNNLFKSKCSSPPVFHWKTYKVPKLWNTRCHVRRTFNTSTDQLSTFTQAASLKCHPAPPRARSTFFFSHTLTCKRLSCHCRLNYTGLSHPVSKLAAYVFGCISYCKSVRALHYDTV